MGRKRIVLVSSSEEMILFGRQLASQIPPGSVLALSGDLGAGKTTFVQGLALGLAIQDPIQSPTFVYLNRYEGTLPLFHFDLYRMKDSHDFMGMGFHEYWDMGGVAAIEWPERISPILPQETIRLFFRHHEQGREIEYEL